MRFIAYEQSDGSPGLGLRIDQDLVELTALGLPATLKELLQAAGGLDAARSAAARAKARRPLADIRYAPPIGDPSKAIAVGLNYVDHAAESKFDPPNYPVLFHRFASRGSATASRSSGRTCRSNSTTRANWWW